jgi:hypothetical protein
MTINFPYITTYTVHLRVIFLHRAWMRLLSSRELTSAEFHTAFWSFTFLTSLQITGGDTKLLYLIPICVPDNR